MLQASRQKNKTNHTKKHRTQRVCAVGTNPPPSPLLQGLLERPPLPPRSCKGFLMYCSDSLRPAIKITLIFVYLITYSRANAQTLARIITHPTTHTITHITHANACIPCWVGSDLVPMDQPDWVRHDGTRWAILFSLYFHGFLARKCAFRRSRHCSSRHSLSLGPSGCDVLCSHSKPTVAGGRAVRSPCRRAGGAERAAHAPRTPPAIVCPHFVPCMQRVTSPIARTFTGLSPDDFIDLPRESCK
jgi:hypothetical protein